MLITPTSSVRSATKVSLEIGLLYLLAASIMIGTNFPFISIAGRTIYLGTTEVIIVMLSVALILKLFLGAKLAPKKAVISIIMFLMVLPLSVIYQLLFSQVEVLTTAYIEIIRWYLYVAVFFIVMLAVKSERQIRNILIIILLCVIAHIAVGLYQAATFDFYTQRIYGLFVSAANREGLAVSNPNVFGSIIMACSLFFLSYALNRGGRYRSLFVVLLIPSIIVLLMSFSRSAFLGFLVGFVILLALYRVSAVKILAIFWAVVVMFIVVISSSEFLQLRLLGTFDLQGGSVAAESITTRFFLWEQVILSMPEHLFFGVGYGNFSSYFDDLTADNYYIEVLATTGILGLFLLVYMFSQIILYVYRAKAYRNTYYFSFRAAYLAAFVGILVASMFAGLFYNPRVMGLFWFFTALMFRYIQLNRVVTMGNYSVSEQRN